MNYKKFLGSVFLLTFTLNGFTQLPGQKNKLSDTVLVNTLLQESKGYFSDSPAKAIEIAGRAKSIAEKLHYKKGQAYALKNIGISYYFQGKYLEALDHYHQSLGIFKESGDNVGIANMYSNIGVVYYDQGDDAKALENYLASLKYAELSGDKLRMLTALNNVGGVYYIKPSTHNKALQYYLLALPICEELGKTEELGAISVNIGSIYFDNNDDNKAMLYFNKALKAYGNSEGSLNAYNALGKVYARESKFDLALRNHNQALTLAEKLSIKISIVQSLMGVGSVYVKKQDFKSAIGHFQKAETIALEIRANHELKDLYQLMSMCYAKTADYGNAFKYQSLFSNVKDSLYNIDTDKKLGTLQFDFDLQKKQGEINLLTKDKALSELQVKRQKLARNAFAVGLAMVFMITILIFKNYRAKVKTNKILDQQKVQIEQLLLNILPAEVAKELQVNGHATPRNYESVAVMFTDFKGFTTLADKLSPQELVEELNTCFIAFDNIIDKYKLEKIKTIGDSYMCAAGIPTPDEMYAYNIVKASLEIQEYIIMSNTRRIHAGLDPWDLRIGVHVGPVVAGVVGKKKYAYDIWGSAVNIASRMESNGAAGQVNISTSTYELVKHEFVCSHRGKIHAKNVGEIDMYFVESEIRIKVDDLPANSYNEDKTPLFN
ncbi:MAG: adenylate/guanylate cyclase domain-containing protein [Ferruginibacter sp.]